MDKKQIEDLCKFMFSVNLLVDNVECLMEAINDGEEIEQVNLDYVQIRINSLREKEVAVKQMLGIE